MQKVLMQFGQYAGQPIDQVPLPYLIWSLTRFNLRREYPDFISAALVELRRRLAVDMNGAVDAMLMPPMPKAQLPRSRRPIRPVRQEREMTIEDLRKKVINEAVANARVRQGMKV